MKLGQVEARTHKMSYEFLVEVDSNILLEITSIVPRKLVIYTNSYDNIHDAGNTAH